jgi:hypothetical protein
VGLEQGPLSLMSTNETPLGRNSSCSGLENENRAIGIVGTNFADKQRSLGRYSLLADPDHGVFFNAFLFFSVFMISVVSVIVPRVRVSHLIYDLNIT